MKNKGLFHVLAIVHDFISKMEVSHKRKLNCENKSKNERCECDSRNEEL